MRSFVRLVPLSNNMIDLEFQMNTQAEINYAESVKKSLSRAVFDVLLDRRFTSPTTFTATTPGSPARWRVGAL